MKTLVLFMALLSGSVIAADRVPVYRSTGGSLQTLPAACGGAVNWDSTTGTFQCVTAGPAPTITCAPGYALFWDGVTYSCVDSWVNTTGDTMTGALVSTVPASSDAITLTGGAYMNYGVSYSGVPVRTWADATWGFRVTTRARIEGALTATSISTASYNSSNSGAPFQFMSDHNPTVALDHGAFEFWARQPLTATEYMFAVRNQGNTGTLMGVTHDGVTYASNGFNAQATGYVFPDATVQATAAVPLTGGTMTGALAVPYINLTNTSNGVQFNGFPVLFSLGDSTVLYSNALASNVTATTPANYIVSGSTLDANDLILAVTTNTAALRFSVDNEGDVVAASTVKSSSGGFVFPDATTQTTAFDPGIPFVTWSASASLTNENVLTGGTNVTIDNSVGGVAKVNVSPQGTGSGLDADKLDGQHASYFAAAGTCAVGKFVIEVGSAGPVCADLPGADNARYMWTNAAGAQTIATATWTDINYDTIDYDNSVTMGISTTPWILSVTKAGVYHLSAAVRLDTGGNSAATQKLAIRRKAFGAELYSEYIILDMDQRDGTNFTNPHMHGSTDFYAGAGDLFTVAVYQDSGANWFTNSLDVDTYVSIHRLSP